MPIPELSNKIGMMKENVIKQKDMMMNRKNEMIKTMESKKSQMEAMKNSIKPKKPELNVPKPAKPVLPEVKTAPVNRPFKLPQVASISKRIMRPY